MGYKRKKSDKIYLLINGVVVINVFDDGDVTFISHQDQEILLCYFDRVGPPHRFKHQDS